MKNIFNNNDNNNSNNNKNNNSAVVHGAIGIKKALPPCGGDTSFCPGPYPTAACPQCHIGC